MAAKNEPKSPEPKQDEKQHRTAYVTALMAVVATVVAAGIGLGGVAWGAQISRDASESMQLREMKQTRYSSAIGAMELSVASFRSTLGHMKNNRADLALKEAESYGGGDDLVQQLTSLALIADGDVVETVGTYLDASDDFRSDLLALALVLDRGSAPAKSELDAAEAKLKTAEDKKTDVLLAMRIDLNLAPARR